jgi:hypothetical protein
VTFLVFLTVAVFWAPGVIVVMMGADQESAGVAGLGFLLMLLAVAPSLTFFLRWFFAPPMVVLEDVRGTAALRRSWALTRGLTGKILGTTLLAWLLLFALLFIVGALLAVVLIAVIEEGIGTGFYAVNHVVNALVTILITPFTTLVTVLLYFDARIRKEAFDLEVMARQLGEPAPPGA